MTGNDNGNGICTYGAAHGTIASASAFVPDVLIRRGLTVGYLKQRLPNRLLKIGTMQFQLTSEVLTFTSKVGMQVSSEWFRQCPQFRKRLLEDALHPLRSHFLGEREIDEFSVAQDKVEGTEWALVYGTIQKATPFLQHSGLIS